MRASHSERVQTHLRSGLRLEPRGSNADSRPFHASCRILVCFSTVAFGRQENDSGDMGSCGPTSSFVFTSWRCRFKAIDIRCSMGICGETRSDREGGNLDINLTNTWLTMEALLGTIDRYSPAPKRDEVRPKEVCDAEKLDKIPLTGYRIAPFAAEEREDWVTSASLIGHASFISPCL